jgi:hypothetical protein
MYHHPASGKRRFFTESRRKITPGFLTWNAPFAEGEAEFF